MIFPPQTFTSISAVIRSQNPPPPGLHSRPGAVWWKMSAINHAGCSYHVSQRKWHIFGYSEQIIAINVTLALETDLLGVHLDTKVCPIARASVFNTSACVVTCQVH